MEDIFEKERREWEAKHPNQDYDTFINNEVDELINEKYENTNI